MIPFDRAIVQKRYQEALHAFIERVRADKSIIAVLVYGSYVTNELWDKSDIDLWIVGTDETRPFQPFSLLENGIDLHAEVISRNTLKRYLQGSLQGSIASSIFDQSQMVYCSDPSFQEFYENRHGFGDRDRSYQLLRLSAGVIGGLIKAEKWLIYRNDLCYSALHMLKIAEDIARIDLITQGILPDREALLQAMTLRPKIFSVLYEALIVHDVTLTSLREAIQLVKDYLLENAGNLFKPIFSYLSSAGEIRAASEMDRHFLDKVHLEPGDNRLNDAYHWLTEQGMLQKIEMPVRLTAKSRTTVNEAGYFYAGGMN